jgi:hypothetical protein
MHDWENFGFSELLVAAKVLFFAQYSCHLASIVS